MGFLTSIAIGATLCLIMIQSTPAKELAGATSNLRLITIPLRTSSNISTADTRTRTAYQVLEDYIFPTGLLPKGVTSYDLNSSTGKFSVHFNDTCTFSLQNSRQLKFKSTIKGYISNGKISSLEGVYVRLLFMVWMEIVEILWSGDDLVFTVGLLSTAFPVDNFGESPHCDL